MSYKSHKFMPPDTVKSISHLKSCEDYQRLYNESINTPNEFWEKFAQKFHWKQFPKFHSTWNFDIHKGPISIKWFDGGLFNACYNVLDVNIQKGNGHHIAYIWVPNDKNEEHKQITYRDLLIQVCKFAQVLKAKGIKKGDRVCLYMPMIVHLPIAMLACARIGAIHSVVFAGYSAESLADRLKYANVNIIVTTDGNFRGDKFINLKPIVDEAIDLAAQSGVLVKHCIVVRHVTPPLSNHTDNFLSAANPPSQNSSATGNVHGNHLINTHNSYDIAKIREIPKHHDCKRPAKDYQIPWNDSIDTWWEDEMDAIKTSNSGQDFYVEPEWLDPEDPLFMLYTSGSTGTPKGVLHTCAGYLIYAATTFLYVFDYHPGEIYFCTADVGWITGHSYGVYGPLANGATSIMFEGIPTFPEPDRYWDIVEVYKVSKFYTSPTAIRALMKFGPDYVKKHDLSSLRILGTVGEPINPEAWYWYYEIVGGKKCVVVDTYWQTETGGHVLTPLPGAIPTKAGSAAMPFFGVEPVILDENGKEIKDQKEGFLCFKRAWPGIMRTVYNCQERFEKGYFHKFPGYYTTGDGAYRDTDGYFWISGRIDDMMNVSGHLLSTAAVESALQKDAKVAECAVVAIAHPVKGQCLYCFVTLKNGIEFNHQIVKELKEMIAEKIGRFALPDYVQSANALPKTRSGKIMRRILRGIAQGDAKSQLGDISTLADESVLDALIRDRIQTPKS